MSVTPTAHRGHVAPDIFLAIGLGLQPSLPDGFCAIIPDRLAKPQFYIRRGCQHDGTLIFTYEMWASALAEMLRGSIYYKPDPPNGRKPRYIIGPVRLYGFHGIPVDLPCGRRRGTRERISIPVRVVYGAP